MKVRIAMLISTFLISLIVCTISSLYVNDVISDVLKDASSAETFMKDGDFESAKKYVEFIKDKIEKNKPILESLLPHEDLHDLVIEIRDVCLSLSINDLDDMKKALELFRENAAHLKGHEGFSLGNIF